jgi:hypothetical protein
LGDYAREKAQRYSWQSIASEVVEVYQEARGVAAEHAAKGLKRLEVTNVHNAV